MINLTTQGRTKTKIQMTDRDKQILRLCLEQKFLTFGHVESFFPERAAKFSASKRIAALRDAGMIRVDPSHVLQRHLIVTLTRYGEVLAGDGCPIELDMGLKAQRSTLDHDAIVTSARLSFSTLFPGSKWLPERAIKPMKLDYLPDGIVELTSGERIAIEVENSIKWKARYHALMYKNWADLPRFDKVLFIATNDKIAAAIGQCLSASPEHPTFGVMKVTDLKNGQTNFVTKNRVIMTLSDLEKAS